MESKTRAVVYLAMAALMWSSGGVLIKLVDWHPLAIAGVRSAWGALTLLAVMRRRPVFNWSAPQIGAAVGYAATVVFLVASTRLTTAANAIFLQYTAPLYIALVAPRLLNEPTRPRDWFFVAMITLGMCLFFLDRLTPQGVLGIICGIISGMGFATTVLCLRQQKTGSTAESMILGNALAALVGLPFVFGQAPPPADWLMLAVLGVFQLGLPYYLFSLAVKRVTALEAALIPMAEPVLNPCWVLLAVGETPGSWALLGGTLVLGGAALRGWLSARS